MMPHLQWSTMASPFFSKYVLNWRDSHFKATSHLSDLQSFSITQSSSINADQNRPDSFSFQHFKLRAVYYVNLGDRFNQLFHQCFSRCARVGDRGRYKLLKRMPNPWALIQLLISTECPIVPHGLQNLHDAIVPSCWGLGLGQTSNISWDELNQTVI